jgi:UDP-N-acetylmuramoyl-tripeptide--D-alanyl-D-alanine ligase
MRLLEISKAIGSDFKTDAEITHISTDTRDMTPGSLFVALTGENFDGHRFIDEAFEKGAAFAVSMQAGEWDKDRVLLVKDTRQAYLDIARLHRQKLGTLIVGVTGSVGKTTTKEMTARVLGARYMTLKNEANLNNEIGLSSTILKLNEAYEAAVLEMGMDGPGQIRKLARAALPDIGVITNVGVSHLEAFGSRENILREKLGLVSGMADGKTLILNADNDLLGAVLIPRLNVIHYGIDDLSSPIRAENITEFSTHTNFEAFYDGNRFDAQIPVAGRHNVYNALAAFSVGLRLGIPPQNALAALKNYRPAGMRQNIVVHNSYTVVEDCYNASPDSVHAALETLGKLKCDGRRIAVLSDMLELGGVAEKAHYDMGRVCAANGVDYLLCTGDLARGYFDGAKAAGMKNAAHYKDQDALFEAVKELVAPGDICWFKASRGMKLEKVIERLYNT